MGNCSSCRSCCRCYSVPTESASPSSPLQGSDTTSPVIPGVPILPKNFTPEYLDWLLVWMEQLIAKLEKKEAPPRIESSSFPDVSESVKFGRSLVEGVCKDVEDEVNVKSKEIGTSSEASSAIREWVRASLNSRTLNLLSQVLNATTPIPYLGAVTSCVVFALEQAENFSANDQKRLDLLKRMARLIKHIKNTQVKEDMLKDILEFAFKTTVSLAQRMDATPFKKFAFAYPDADDLQSMEKELGDKYTDLLLESLPRVIPVPSKLDSNKVEMEHERAQVLDKLKWGDACRRIVAIHGIGGIGKTTLADQVYNFLDKSSYSVCKLEMKIDSTDITKLHKQLLLDAFRDKVEVTSESYGRTEISKAIKNESRRPLFLYIDNAMHNEEVESLLPSDTLSSLPLKSRIIVTTRNLKQVEALRAMTKKKEEFQTYLLGESKESMQILKKHALKDPNSNFDKNVNVEELLRVCKGIPLLIKMAGQQLFGAENMETKCKEIIEDINNEIRQETTEQPGNENNYQMVDFVYRHLSADARPKFLDIAIFFNNWRRRKIGYIFKERVLKELEDAALLSCTEEGRVKIHDIVVERARAISKKEIITDRESWERVRNNPEMLKTVKGIQLSYNALQLRHKKEDIDSINMCTQLSALALTGPPDWREVNDTPTELHLPRTLQILCLKRLKNLRVIANSCNNLTLMKAKEVEFSEGWTEQKMFEMFQKSTYLELPRTLWHEASLRFLQGLSSLRGLRIDCSDVHKLDIGFQRLPSLESLTLDGCQKLSMLPDTFVNKCLLKILKINECHVIRQLPASFVNLSNLEVLVIINCYELEYLPKTLQRLSKLKKLDIGACEMLEKLPNSFGDLKSLEELDIGLCTSLNALPQEFGNLASLKKLYMKQCEGLQNLPNSFGDLKSLEKLDIGLCTSLNALPQEFGNLKSLIELKMVGCKRLQNLPNSFGDLKSLEELDIGSCTSLNALPQEFGNLASLKKLYMKQCEGLQNLPNSFGDLKSLEKLDIGSCTSLNALPQEFGNLTNLKRLDMEQCERFKNLPNSFGDLKSLEELDIGSCISLNALPQEFGNLTSLKRFYMKYCVRLKNLPNSFGDLKSLEVLEMLGCKSLNALPQGFGSLTSLRDLCMNRCGKLQNLPNNFGGLTSLEKLDITNCTSLNALPQEFGNLTRLTNLYMTGCERLQNLPYSFGDLKSLELLDISHCTSLDALPQELGNLTSLIELKMARCKRLQNVPNSFGNLKSLERLDIGLCTSLNALPQEIWNLPGLTNLYMEGFERLQNLPNSFGDLNSLEWLDISYCTSLNDLPQEFGNLINLRELYMRGLKRLQNLPNSFGGLKSLEKLDISYCTSLNALPQEFGNLTSLRFLHMAFCERLQNLPDSLDDIKSLQAIDIRECKSLNPIHRRLNKPYHIIL